MKASILSPTQAATFATWLVVALVAPRAHADSITTDRPDVVESSDVVGRGHVQMGTGGAAGRRVDRRDARRRGRRGRRRHALRLLQLDVSASRGLTRETPDLQWGVGLSFRF